MRTMTIALFALLLAPAVLAQDAPTLHPACGAPGDPVLLRGDGFGDDPAVEFGDTAADVLRSDAGHILVRVPDGLSEGAVTVSVDGTAAAEDFTVLPAGAPVVLHMSATKATPGQHVFLIGRRLRGATADFVDSAGDTAATVALTGGRAAVLTVPGDLAPGSYLLRITNDAASSGDCSPTLEVVEAGAATLEAIEPSEQLPGRPVLCTGSDLGPVGPVMVVWSRDGEEMHVQGFSNGFDRVHTAVPPRAEAGATYEVSIELRNGGSTADEGLVEYTVGTPDAPSIESLDPDQGPAGTPFRIHGQNLLVSFGSKPTVTMSDGTTTETAKVLFGMPGFHGHDDTLVAVVPEDLADGDYDVTVTVGGQTSDAAVFTVAAPELAVEALKPDHQGNRGPRAPVRILGGGFGHAGGPELAVTWTHTTTGDVREGFVLVRHDRLLVVVPPGGRQSPLAAGTYDVEVTVGDDSVSAGTYTVE